MRFNINIGDSIIFDYEKINNLMTIENNHCAIPYALYILEDDLCKLKNCKLTVKSTHRCNQFSCKRFKNNCFRIEPKENFLEGRSWCHDLFIRLNKWKKVNKNVYNGGKNEKDNPIKSIKSKK